MTGLGNIGTALRHGLELSSHWLPNQYMTNLTISGVFACQGLCGSNSDWRQYNRVVCNYGGLKWLCRGLKLWLIYFYTVGIALHPHSHNSTEIWNRRDVNGLQLSGCFTSFISSEFAHSNQFYLYWSFYDKHFHNTALLKYLWRFKLTIKK